MLGKREVLCEGVHDGIVGERGLIHGVRVMRGGEVGEGETERADVEETEEGEENRSEDAGQGEGEGGWKSDVVSRRGQ